LWRLIFLILCGACCQECDRTILLTPSKFRREREEREGGYIITFGAIFILYDAFWLLGKSRGFSKMGATTFRKFSQILMNLEKQLEKNERERKADLLEFEDKLVRIILFENLTPQLGEKLDKEQPPRENILTEQAKKKLEYLQNIFMMTEDRSKHLNQSLTLDLFTKDIKIRYDLQNNFKNIIFLNIEHSTALFPKDTSITNNPFFTVNYQDQEWISSTQYNTLNPKFNESIAICLTHGDITINLWNRNSKNNDQKNATKYQKDAHLGLIVITPSMVDSKHYTLNLQKRHKRSNCSGTLDFSIEFLFKKNTSQILRQCCKLIISNPKLNFEQFLTNLLLFELKTNDLKSIDKITKPSADLIKSIMYYWEIDEHFYLLTTFKILVIEFQKKSVGLEIISEVFNKSIQNFCPSMKVNRTEQRRSGSSKNVNLVITPEEVWFY
jgi:hypothetical protein